MVNYEHSYKFGKAGEKRVLPVITEFFKREVLATEDRYSKYDFICPEYNYEVKSRTNCFNKYPDTMITMNKLIDGDKPLILLFNFTDALYYIQYDAELFSKFSKIMFSRVNEEWDEKEHVYIPLQYLKHIHNW